MGWQLPCTNRVSPCLPTELSPQLLSQVWALLPLPGRQSRVPCAGAAGTQHHAAKPLLVSNKLLQGFSSGCPVKVSFPAAVLEIGVLPGTQQINKIICLAPSCSRFTRQQQKPGYILAAA